MLFLWIILRIIYWYFNEKSSVESSFKFCCILNFNITRLTLKVLGPHFSYKCVAIWEMIHKVCKPNFKVHPKTKKKSNFASWPIFTLWGYLLPPKVFHRMSFTPPPPSFPTLCTVSQIVPIKQTFCSIIFPRPKKPH